MCIFGRMNLWADDVGAFLEVEDEESATFAHVLMLDTKADYCIVHLDDGQLDGHSVGSYCVEMGTWKITGPATKEDIDKLYDFIRK